jgi:DNA-binding NtrC family response regulator
LIADRFFINDRGDTIDLATGAPVSLMISAAGGPTEQARWAERCAWFASLVHPSISPLIDYGPFGEAHRFEVWLARSRWAGSVAAAEQCLVRVNRFLDACGRTAVSAKSLAALGSRPVVLPDTDAGLSDHTSAPIETAACPQELLGTLREADRRVTLTAEILNAPPGQRSMAVSCWAAEGESLEHAIRLIARTARLAGYIPLSAAHLNERVREVVKGRSLVLLAEDDAQRGWRAFIQATLDVPTRHVVVFASHTIVPHVHTIALSRHAVDALVASVCPASAVRGHLRHISAAARRSGGLRTRFEQLLFGYMLPEGSRASRNAARAAEPVVTFDATVTTVLSDSGRAHPWPAPGELTRLRGRVTDARALLGAGRHEPGLRLMRKAVTALGRRGDWASAAEGALALAEALMGRGRLQDAQHAIDHARPWFAQSGNLPLLQRIAILQAAVWIESARLVEAEALLDATVAAAMSANTGLLTAATLVLARCLYCRGRYVEAWQRLSTLSDAELSPEDQVRLRIVRAHVALGRGWIADAASEAATARHQSAAAGASLAAQALHACAFTQLTAGHRTQADATAAAAIACARRTHDALLVLRLRLLRAEIARRQGRRSVASLVVARTLRLAPRLPVTIRAQAELLRDLLAGAPPERAAAQRADATGLQALQLLVAGGEPSPANTCAPDDIVELLRCCHSATDDAAVLGAVAARVRNRLSAAGISFFVFDVSEPVSVSADGVRVEARVAHRVRAAGQLVLPHYEIERPEAGVPVRYGGDVIGILAVTWNPTARWHEGDVALLLSTAASAAGPALSGVLSRRRAERTARVSPLIGISRGIQAVRDAIDKAAGAPFGVLIEGESGSGKELVARLLHKEGPRRDRLFCTLNCAALPDDLIESELFGHSRGAFTGAMGERPGLFEEAHGGTLFLDEVGELSLRAQAKLLRAVQEGEIRRVGENLCRRVDVRLVAATNRPLRDEVAQGRFRLDLFYRLDVIRITLPALRDRREDIALLAEHFWREATGRLSSRAVLSSGVLAALARYDWPGNIREVQNVLTSLAVRSPRRGVVEGSALPPSFDQPAIDPGTYRLDVARRLFERSFIYAALVRAGGQRTRAADELGITRQGLAKLMDRLDIRDGNQCQESG